MDNGQARMRDLRVVYVSYLPPPPPPLSLSFSLSPFLPCSAPAVAVLIIQSAGAFSLFLCLPACMPVCQPACILPSTRTHYVYAMVWHYVYATRQIQLSSWSQLWKADSVNAASHLLAFSPSPVSVFLSLSLSRTSISTLSLYVSQLFNNFVASAAHVVVATKPFKLLENALTTWGTIDSVMHNSSSIFC